MVNKKFWRGALYSLQLENDARRQARGWGSYRIPTNNGANYRRTFCNSRDRKDITLQKELEKQLSALVEKRTEELHRSNEDLLHFAHTVSHDFKEPVRKVKIFNGML